MVGSTLAGVLIIALVVVGLILFLLEVTGKMDEWEE